MFRKLEALTDVKLQGAKGAVKEMKAGDSYVMDDAEWVKFSDAARRSIGSGALRFSRVAEVPKKAPPTLELRRRKEVVKRDRKERTEPKDDEK